jgi:trans-aconitate methyltransferase
LVPPTDNWAQGDLYEPYIGRWSRRVAPRFLGWLDLPAGLRWVDVGAGTGALTSAIVDRADPRSVLAVEPSPGFSNWSRERIHDPRVEFRLGDASSLEPSSADVVVSGLVLNFVTDVTTAVRAMADAAAGGIVAGYVWDYAEGMELLARFWQAAEELDPTVAGRSEVQRFPLCRPEPLAGLWRAAGIAEVTTVALEVDTVFEDADDLWQPFLGGQGPAPGYVSTLSEDGRVALRDRLLALLPASPDGSIPLRARAWGVRGRAPA